MENVDVLDGTPVLDIKPYSSKFYAVENERIGWTEKNIEVPTKRNRTVDLSKYYNRLIQVIAGTNH